jgi:hypothetical protein
MGFFREEKKKQNEAQLEDFPLLDPPAAIAVKPPSPPGDESDEPGELPEDTRKQIKKNPIEMWSDPLKFKQWVKVTRQVAIEALDDRVANETYGAALWKFREAALSGDYTATRSMEIWLNWASKKLRERKNPPTPVNNKNAANFGARDPE